MGAWCKKKHNWETATEKFYQHKLVFIHIPKTSGTSIANAVYGTFFGHYPLSSLRKNDAGKRLDSFEKFTIVRNPYDQKVSGFLHSFGTAPNNFQIYKEILGGQTLEKFGLNSNTINKIKSSKEAVHVMPILFRKLFKTLYDRCLNEKGELDLKLFNFSGIVQGTPSQVLSYLFSYKHWLENTNFDKILRFENRNEINCWIFQKTRKKVDEYRNKANDVFRLNGESSYMYFYDQVTKEIVQKIYREDFVKYNYEM